jgi:hypothetical protein
VGFDFAKWYLDCVDDHGRATIAYWTSLRYRGLSVAWHSVAVYEPDGTVARRSSTTRCDPPEHRDHGIRWRAPALGVGITCESRQSIAPIRLLERGAESVEWQCHAPSACVHVSIDDREMRGRGYVERLAMSYPPWRLPIQELRWGRWTDAAGARSLVWIDWRGPEPRSWVFADGARIAATVADVAVTADGMTLELPPGRVLERSTLGSYLDTIPLLPGLVPASLHALGQTRWLTTAILSGPDQAPLSGWAVHEVVRFP